MDITEKAYSFMKTSKDKNGYVPTIQQISDGLNLPDHEVKAVIEQLKEAGRIKITDIPREVKIELV